MKRLAILTLPLLATIFAVGIGLFVFRAQFASLWPRFGAGRASEQAEPVPAGSPEEALE
jgi:hypothetical protein